MLALSLTGWIIHVKLAPRSQRVTSAPIVALNQKSMMKCMPAETTDASQSVQSVRRPKIIALVLPP